SRVAPFPVYPTAITVDAATGRVFLSDSTGGQLAEIDPDSGEVVRMLSGPEVGSGVPLAVPHEAVLDVARNRLLAVNAEVGVDRAAVVAIDLSTLERTEISG